MKGFEPLSFQIQKYLNYTQHSFSFSCFESFMLSVGPFWKCILMAQDLASLNKIMPFGKLQKQACWFQLIIYHENYSFLSSKLPPTPPPPPSYGFLRSIPSFLRLLKFFKYIHTDSGYSATQDNQYIIQLLLVYCPKS